MPLCLNRDQTNLRKNATMTELVENVRYLGLHLINHSKIIQTLVNPGRRKDQCSNEGNICRWISIGDPFVIVDLVVSGQKFRSGYTSLLSCLQQPATCPYSEHKKIKYTLFRRILRSILISSQA
jgi:hypothetical protein